MSLSTYLNKTEPSERRLEDAIRASRLLIVEDQAIIRSLLGNFAALKGYQSTTVENGHLALEELAKGYDLLLTDGNYPPEGCRPVIEEALKTIPDDRILLLTGNPLEFEDLQYRKGITIYTKPRSMDQVFRYLSEGVEQALLGAPTPLDGHTPRSSK